MLQDKPRLLRVPPMRGLLPRSRAGRIAVSLALQGGGAHGAFTWGVLDRLLEEEAIDIKAVSGTSAGAINAVALASGWCQGVGKVRARPWIGCGAPWAARPRARPWARAASPSSRSASRPTCSRLTSSTRSTSIRCASS